MGQDGSQLRLPLPSPAGQKRSNQKVKVEMYSRSGRVDKRAPLAVAVRITSLEHHGRVDSGLSQNVSPFGLRVLVGNQWAPNEPVQVESPPGVFRSRAWIVYCQSAQDGEFAVGLRLLTPQPSWTPNGARPVSGK